MKRRSARFKLIPSVQIAIFSGTKLFTLERGCTGYYVNRGPVSHQFYLILPEKDAHLTLAFQSFRVSYFITAALIETKIHPPALGYLRVVFIYECLRDESKSILLIWISEAQAKR